MRIAINGVAVSAISCVVPPDIFRVFSLADEFGEREMGRIVKNTGIEEMRVADERTTAADLCEAAAHHIFNELKIEGGDIDGLIFVSQTPDYILPPTSCVLQHRLGIAKSAFIVDVNQGCSGYVYGLYLASLLISSQSCSRVLILAGDTASKTVNKRDRALKALLGDCGGATLLERGEHRIAFGFHNDGSRFNSLIVPAGGFRNQSNEKTSRVTERENGNWRSDEEAYMDGFEIMKFALYDVVNFVEGDLTLWNLPKEDIGCCVFHQANRFIIEGVAKRLDIPLNKVPMEIRKYGNTSSASIPLALVESMARSGESTVSWDLENTLMVGFGVGLSCGSALCDLSGTRFLSLEEYEETRG